MGGPAAVKGEGTDAVVGCNTWCVLSAAAMEHNVGQLRRRLAAGQSLGAVVKSNAYGHGMVTCAQRALRAGADWLVVNALYEVDRLRQAGVEVPVYVCGPVLAGQAEMAAATGARVVLYDGDTARSLDRAGRAGGRSVPVHIKLETGMHRQGLDLAAALDLARLVRRLDGLELEGLTSHLADMDEIGEGSASHQQVTRFEEAVEAFRQAGLLPPVVHLASSGGALRLPHIPGTLVRAGIAVYGLWPSPKVRAGAGPEAKLQPVLSWYCRVAQVKEIAAGAAIGYGGTYTVARPACVAILPVGYGEGYGRSLSGCGQVLIRGRRHPVRGRVCMNMTIVEITGDLPVRAGDCATLIGRDGPEEITADEVAQWAGTINYEVTTRIHADVPRLVEEVDGRLQLSAPGAPYPSRGCLL